MSATSERPDDAHRAGGDAPQAGGETPRGGGAPGSGLGGVLRQEQFSVSDAVGGPRGIAESVIPTLLFIVLFVVTRSITVAAIAAVGVVVIALVVRLVQRQSPAGVLGGLIGVVLGAVLAIRSGDGTDFYAPGIVINAVALVLIGVSLAARRPLVGLLVAMLDPRMEDWAQDPDARRVYTRATVLFAGLYAVKLAVQIPLLLTGQVAALGVAKLVMGLPAFALLAYLVWLMHRALLARRGHGSPTAEDSADPEGPEGPEEP
ncbi:DUF3159 domain-containing protein [Brachybacterium sp. DNPG3]